MPEKMIQMSRDELQVLTKLLGSMNTTQWIYLGLDAYERQILLMTYRCLAEEFPNV